MDEKNIAETARKHALLNAVKYDGTPNVKAVMGKLMAEKPELRNDPARAYAISGNACKEIEKLSLSKQMNYLQKNYPELLIKEKKERDFTLPPLPDAQKGKVITRFPPEPNGYLHIGHAKAAVVDYEYARMYDGTFILRFDDTNPAAELKKFYDAQKEDLKWLGIEWDREYRTSDHLPVHYELAEKMVREGHAYVCTCSGDTIKKNRRLEKDCSCKKNMGIGKWNEFFSMEEGSAVLRLKGNMRSENTAMRDPTLFRIIDSPHPIHGDKYRIWPTYDFCGAVEDSLSDVTHPFRTKEYELRDEVYFYILDCLGLRKPHLMEFARLSIEGMPVSKRKIKPLIENEQVGGWDDPRLPTLRGLKRRGILPEAICKFVLSQGISKAEAVVTFDQVEAINRKILDPVTRRYFFVPDPIKVLVKNAPGKEVMLDHHPSHKLGSRKIKPSDVFFIPREDANSMKEGEVFRLKDLYNVRLTGRDDEKIMGEFAGKELIPDTKKIQWVTDRYVKMEVLLPGNLFIDNNFNKNSLKIVKGYAEPSIKNAKHGEIIQFERFGFVRIEKDEKRVKGILAHK
ncbi:MAG: glutamate--tRNA ligase [Candidatus Thermoplasmatota archaeon]|nr:glutamate--tRNA ligase [Candidatus Thermoplasmatota archaeon]